MLATSRRGVLTFDPGTSFNNLGEGEIDLVTLAYEISDGNGGTDTATATITVNGLNDAPVATDDAYTVPESGVSVPVTFSILVSITLPISSSMARMAEKPGTRAGWS